MSWLRGLFYNSCVFLFSPSEFLFRKCWINKRRKQFFFLFPMDLVFCSCLATVCVLVRLGGLPSDTSVFTTVFTLSFSMQFFLFVVTWKKNLWMLVKMGYYVWDDSLYIVGFKTLKDCSQLCVDWCESHGNSLNTDDCKCLSPFICKLVYFWCCRPLQNVAFWQKTDVATSFFIFYPIPKVLL